MTQLQTLVANAWPDYALMDSGDGRKLERFGDYTFIRPEMQALWPAQLPGWKADAEFIGGSDEDGGGKWHYDRAVPDAWPVAWGNLKFWASCTAFRHLAFFPDMSVHWDFMGERVRPGDEVLNMFGYTGVASLVAAAAGAKVTHVDASKKAVGAARANQDLSGLQDRPVRWIVEDALKFLRREVRRGRKYSLILLDPPKFGRGPEGERWDLTENLPELLDLARQLVDPARGAVILTVYAIRMSAIALHEAMLSRFADGTLVSGEMTIRHERGERLLPTAIFSRWIIDRI
jgi:23S rRNA (cytosine1962-C5)-methyltransferase